MLARDQSGSHVMKREITRSGDRERSSWRAATTGWRRWSTAPLDRAAGSARPTRSMAPFSPREPLPHTPTRDCRRCTAPMPEAWLGINGEMLVSLQTRSDPAQRRKDEADSHNSQLRRPLSS